MAELWSDIKAYYEEHPCRDRYNHIKLSMFIDTTDPHDKFPKLKGRAIEVKNLVPAMAHIWKARMEENNVAHAAIYEALLASFKMDQILDAYPDTDVLPGSSSQEFVDASWKYARLQNATADYYAQQGLMLFDVTIKTHWTCHCAQHAPFLNPRKSWNFAGEDFMHKCKTLMQSCVKGNSIHQSECKFAEKYIFALHLVFSKYEDQLSED